MHCVFLHCQNSKGIVWADNKNDQTKDAAHLQLELTDNNRPTVSVFGSLKVYPQLTHLKQYIQNWYITDFSMNAARSIPKTGPQKQLSEQGDNLAKSLFMWHR
jgi:hypothetical protein